MPRSSKPPDTCKWGGPKLRGILKFSRPKIPVPSSWLKNDTYLSLAFVHGGTTQHSSTQPWKTVTTWGFWAKKNSPSGACAPLCHGNFILACRKKFIILCDMVRSMSRSMIWSVIWSVFRSGPYSDPVRSKWRLTSWLPHETISHAIVRNWKMAKVAVWKAFVSFLLLFARISFSKGDYSMNGTVYYTDGWVYYFYSVFVTVNLIFGIILWSTSTAKKAKEKKINASYFDVYPRGCIFMGWEWLL